MRIRKSIRGIDLACRYGGEEFVIVMPETDLAVAGMVAERLRRSIAGETVSRSARAPSASRSRSRSGWRRWTARASRSPTCSSAPTRALSRQARRPQPGGFGGGVIVVPANAGTHNHRPMSCEGVCHSALIDRVTRYGSLRSQGRRGWVVASGDNLGVLLHRLIRQPLELERERVDERHLALRHHHAGHVALRRNPPLRARHAAPIEFA